MSPKEITLILTLSAITLGTRAEAQNYESTSTTETRPTARVGGTLSESVQFRIPRIDGVPNSFSNVLGVGLSIQVKNFEIAPQFRLIYSNTSAEVTTGAMSSSASAEGLGWEVGARIAFGWFAIGESGFYFSAWPAFSRWTIAGQFADGSTFRAVVTEFSTEFGLGYKLQLSNSFRLDFSASLMHIGVRPQEQQIVDITSYPTIGIGVDWLW